MSQIAENILSDFENERSGESLMQKVSRHFKKFSSPFFQILSDSLAVLFSYFIQFYITYGTDLFETTAKMSIAAAIAPGIALLAYWLLIFFFSGMYKNWYVRSPFDEIFTIIRVTFFGVAFIAVLVLMSSNQPPRFLFLIYYPVLALSTIIGRYIIRRVQIKLKAKGVISVNSLIIGSPKKSLALHKQILDSKNWGFNTTGLVFITNDGMDEISDEDFETVRNLPVINRIDNLSEILDSFMPEQVLIATDIPDIKQLMKIASLCAERNIAVKIEPDVYHIFSGQARTMHLYGIPLIDISTQLLKPWQAVIKRMFDIVFSLLVLILGMPLWLLVALLIKLESKGPVFYQQPRVGKDGKVFMIYKFRSMVKDADKRGSKWTQVNDPRVTKVGKIIRRTHIDEFPQFLNVLEGKMSIVGPRPEQPKFVDEFGKDIPYYFRRLKVRPGITGWWQVKYQPHVLDKEELESRLKDDFYYIENMSLKLDIEIVIRTVWCVVKGHGQA